MMVITIKSALYADEGITRGPETNLPLPRYVSLKSNEANVRRGPSLSHRIDWIFKRKSMPLQITAEYGHWRRVQDPDGVGGWIHYSLLSGTRTVLILQDRLAVRVGADLGSRVRAELEEGVVAKLRGCTLDWCRVLVGGYQGWVLKTGLWGVGVDEIRD